MAGMTRMSPKTHGGSARAAFLPHAPACLHHACAQPPAAMGGQPTGFAFAPAVPVRNADVAGQFAPKRDLQVLADRGPPPVPAATPVTLHTTLRV